MSRFRVGEVVGGTKLRNAYDRCAVDVLGSYLEVQRDGSKGQRKYKICKELPGPDEYTELRKQRYTITISSLVSDAFSELESLYSEMDEWYNNMPEGLQQGDTGQRVEEAASVLSDHTSEPDISEEVGAIAVYFVPSSCSSRADRCSEAAGMLRTAAETLLAHQERLSKYKELDDDTSSEIDDLASQLEETAEEVEGVEFPGMYG